MNLLQKGESWLNEQRHKHLTQTVTYVRDIDTVELSATVGKTPFEQVSEQNTVITYESRDYIIQTADLALNGIATLPQAGDQIHETVGTTKYIYEVLVPGGGGGRGGEPCWRYSDPHRLALRIHTKHIDTV